MQPSLEKLRKFFRLEHENGYNNIAIIGGLAKMLDYWEGDARADGIQEEVIQAVIQRLRSYEGLTPQSRADALRGLWKRIGDTYPEATQRTRPVQRVETQSKPRPIQPPQEVPPPPEPPRREYVEQPQRHERVAPPRSDNVPGAKTSATPAALDAKLTVLQGVGPSNAASLARLGLHTLGDMLYYSGERDVHLAGEGPHELVRHEQAEVGRLEVLLDLLDVALLLDRLEDGGVRRGAADAALLHLLHERGLVVARRRLREVLVGVELPELERHPRLERRELALLVLPRLLAVRAGALRLLLLGARLLLRRLRAVYGEVARELEDRARRAERRAAGGDVGGGLVVDGGDHLAGDEPVPDELVQPELVALADRLEERRDALGRPLEAGRPD